MTGTIEKVLAEIRKGARSSVYLLFGDELLAREGAKAIVDVLVPTAKQTLSVEVVAEDSDANSLPLRLRTLPLFGGIKVVVVHDTKAFVSKQSASTVFAKSREAWKGGNPPRAMKLLREAAGAAGQDRVFLERAAKGELPEAIWDQLLKLPHDDESDRWLQETAGRLMAEGAEVSDAPGAGTAQIYDDILQQGIPPGAVLILTAEVVDQRRALFKRIQEAGAIVDCGIRTGKMGETQMRPEMARAKIREQVAGAKKTIDEDAAAGIVDRTGFSMRALESEIEKILLYVGNRPRIIFQDVTAVLSTTREAGVFDLTNAVDEREAGRALRALRGLLAQREAGMAILGLLAGEVRNLTVARCVLERRLEGKLDPQVSYAAFQARIVPRLSAEGEEDDGSAAKLKAMHPFRAFNLLKAAGRYRLEELLRALSAIHEADLALKTSGQPESLILENLVLGLCGGEARTRGSAGQEGD
jgi:DNA polymerase-3 subunit delta